MAVILCHGAMFSGKSDLAMKIVQSFSRKGLSRVLYQPRENTRDVFMGKPIWYSRAGGAEETTTLKARWYDSAEEVLAEKDKFDVFGFEEWHLFNPEIYSVIKSLDKAGKIVVAAGGDYYFNGEPVEIFEKLRRISGARLLQGVGALCEECSAKGKHTLASRTQRMFGIAPDFFDSPKIIVDGNQDYRYMPTCFDHWRVDQPKDSTLMGEYSKWYSSKKKNH